MSPLFKSRVEAEEHKRMMHRENTLGKVRERNHENEMIANQVKIEMVLRELHPSLKDAWDKYQTVLKIVENK